MIARTKRILGLLLPPFVTNTLRAVQRARREKARAEWEYLPDGWPVATGMSAGWDHESVAKTQLNGWPGFLDMVRAPNPVSRLSGPDGLPVATDYAAHNTRMAFGYVVGLAALGRDRLSMLDWGGGLGHYAELARTLFPELYIDYQSRELPTLARYGRSVLPNATFHEDDGTAFSRAYDLVLVSGSLQYVKDWRETLGKLARSTNRLLYVTRLPVVERAEAFVVMQRPQHGYQTEYPGWVLNRGEFLRVADGLGLTLIREFLIWERSSVAGAPEQADYRGFLFAASAK